MLPCRPRSSTAAHRESLLLRRLKPDKRTPDVWVHRRKDNVQGGNRYTIIAVKGGTIFIDSSLCGEDASTGRLRFTCAHELAHWLLHKKIYSGTGKRAAMVTGQSITETQNNTFESQANLLGSILLMPLPQVKRCFYRLQSGRDRQKLVADMADIFQVSKQAMRIRLENHHLL